jgi:hypothetical protein
VSKLPFNYVVNSSVQITWFHQEITTVDSDVLMCSNDVVEAVSNVVQWTTTVIVKTAILRRQEFQPVNHTVPAGNYHGGQRRR